MSLTFAQLIPTDPLHMPTPKQRKAIAALLEATLAPLDISYALKATKTPRLIDAGKNFDGVYCPHCNQELELAWWQQALDSARQTQFLDLATQTPCCGYRCSLNDLTYDWPQGFARFNIILNDIPVMLVSELTTQIAALVTCPLACIWTRH